MYLYEMHQHSSGCSLCAVTKPTEVVRAIKESGFSGVVITNHFYHGNTAIYRSLEWDKFCDEYKKEYLLAKEEGDKVGVDVLYGLEEGLGDGKEVLIYGISPDLIGKYPELREVNLPLLSKIVRENGGVIFQAHPFRERSYISNVDVMLPPEYLDGYEGYNMGNKSQENKKAVALAKKNNLPVIAGSDCHTYLTEGRFGIACSHRITNEKELAEVLKNGDYELCYNEN